MSIRLGQALSGVHSRLSRSRALARMTSFLMIAVRASLAGFPALSRISAFETKIWIEERRFSGSS